MWRTDLIREKLVLLCIASAIVLGSFAAIASSGSIASADSSQKATPHTFYGCTEAGVGTCLDAADGTSVNYDAETNTGVVRTYVYDTSNEIGDGVTFPDPNFAGTTDKVGTAGASGTANAWLTDLAAMNTEWTVGEWCIFVVDKTNPATGAGYTTAVAVQITGVTDQFVDINHRIAKIPQPTITSRVGTSVDLSWSAIDFGAYPVYNMSGYRIYRNSTAAPEFVAVGNVSSATLTFTDTIPDSAGTYWYRLGINYEGKPNDVTSLSKSLATISEPPTAEPTVTTKDATDITTTGATLNMDYTVGTYASVQVRFDYKKTADAVWSYTSWVTKSASGSHSETLTGLDSGTEYQFNATLKYDGTTIYGGVRTFTTLTPGAPTVTTKDATDITTTGATLNMDYTVGDYASVQVRFDYKKTADAVWSNTAWVTKSASGSHSETLTGLDSGTEYQFNATLKYDGTTIYGGVRTFTTLTPAIPTVTTKPATGIMTTSATLNMDYTVGDYVGYTTVQVRFAWRQVGAAAWTYTTWVTKTASGSHSESITGLTIATEYEFKAQLQYDTTLIEGETKTFYTVVTDKVVIRDAPDGGGMEITGPFAKGMTYTLYAAGYNKTTNQYTGPVSGTWSISPPEGIASVDPESGESTNLTGVAAGTFSLTFTWDTTNKKTYDNLKVIEIAGVVVWGFPFGTYWIIIYIVIAVVVVAALATWFAKKKKVAPPT